MALNQLVVPLRGNLSPGARILTDVSSEDFQLALLRWSDLNIKVPGAIIQVANEFDAVTTASSMPLNRERSVLIRFRLGESRIGLPNTLCLSLRRS